MKIAVKQITLSGMEFARRVPPADIGLEDSRDIRYAPEVTVSARVNRTGNTVLARTRVVFEARTFCARCLENTACRSDFEYVFYYEILPETEFIDLGEDIRQEIILHSPAKMLCREDCRGICPNCGANLNRESCRCKEGAPKKAVLHKEP